MFEEKDFKESFQGFLRGSFKTIGPAYDPPLNLSDRAENFFGGTCGNISEPILSFLKNLAFFFLN